MKAERANQPEFVECLELRELPSPQRKVGCAEPYFAVIAEDEERRRTGLSCGLRSA